jgi:hypothetical protein
LAYEALAKRDQRLNSRQRQLLLLIDRQDDSVAMIVQSLMTADNLTVLIGYGLIEPVPCPMLVSTASIEATSIEADMHQPPERLSDAEVERQVEAAKRKADTLKPVSKLYGWLQGESRRVVAAQPAAPVVEVAAIANTEPPRVAVTTEFVLTERALPSFLGEPAQLEPIPILTEPAQPVWQVLDFNALQLLMRETLWQTCGLMGKPLLRKVEAAATVAELRRLQPQWKTSILEVRYREQSDALKQALLNVSENLARLRD